MTDRTTDTDIHTYTHTQLNRQARKGIAKTKGLSSLLMTVSCHNKLEDPGKSSTSK